MLESLKYCNGFLGLNWHPLYPCLHYVDPQWFLGYIIVTLSTTALLFLFLPYRRSFPLLDVQNLIPSCEVWESSYKFWMVQQPYLGALTAWGFHCFLEVGQFINDHLLPFPIGSFNIKNLLCFPYLWTVWVG
jgi:hypothetical protein